MTFKKIRRFICKLIGHNYQLQVDISTERVQTKVSECSRCQYTRFMTIDK